MKKLFLILFLAIFLVGYSNQPLLSEEVSELKVSDTTTVKNPTLPAPVLMNNSGVGQNTTCYFDIIFLAEGFTSSEQSTFNSIAAQARDAILAFEPFNGEEDHINFWRVNTVSGVSSATNGLSEKSFTAPSCGGTTGTNVNVNTPWRVYSNRIGLSRYLGVTPTVRANIDSTYGSYATGSYAQIIIITNTPYSTLGNDAWMAGAEFPGVAQDGTTTYDTGVSIVSRFDDSTYFDFLVVHEFSHTFGGLADEYDNDAEDTLCKMTNHESWYLPATLEPNLKATNPGGWFQGGRYDYTTSGPWREVSNGIMNTGWTASSYPPTSLAAVKVRFKQSVVGSRNCLGW